MRIFAGTKIAGYLALFAGLMLLGAVLILLRFTVVTDYMYHALIKDPKREIPSGNVIVAPADGVVLYVQKITDGVIPEVIKGGVTVPIFEHLHAQPAKPFESGYLIGIYMNTQGVHINRMPMDGTLKKQTIFNGPHMDMTAAETKIILTQMVPGLVTLKKLVGLSPFSIENEADFILKSARETLAFEGSSGNFFYIVRIADYYVGKILTWADEGQKLSKGDKLGMITWGSQTDLLLEDLPSMQITTKIGDYLYGGSSIVATY